MYTVIAKDGVPVSFRNISQSEFLTEFFEGEDAGDALLPQFDAILLRKCARFMELYKVYPFSAEVKALLPSRCQDLLKNYSRVLDFCGVVTENTARVLQLIECANFLIIHPLVYLGSLHIARLITLCHYPRYVPMLCPHNNEPFTKEEKDYILTLFPFLQRRAPRKRPRPSES